jgi:C4-dicarboxylate transporter DctQ subunit
MVAINAAEIVHRVVLTRGLNWVQELSIILAMYLYFLVYALIAKDREYIRIDLLSGALGPRGRRVQAIVVRLLVLVFHGLVAWYAIKTTHFATMFETHVLGWGEWVFYLPLAAGCADIVLTELIHLAWQLSGREDAEAERARGGVLT